MGKGLQSPVHRFDSGRRLHPLTCANASAGGVSAFGATHGFCRQVPCAYMVDSTETVRDTCKTCNGHGGGHVRVNAEDWEWELCPDCGGAGYIIRHEVYILEVGAYDSAGIEGVYSTLEKAQAAWPKGTWTQTRDDYWHNGLDWNDAGIVTRYILDDAG